MEKQKVEEDKKKEGEDEEWRDKKERKKKKERKREKESNKEEERERGRKKSKNRQVSKECSDWGILQTRPTERGMTRCNSLALSVYAVCVWVCASCSQPHCQHQAELIS